MRELYTVSLLKDNDLREAFKEDLKSWMFDEDIPRIIAKVLLKLKTFSIPIVKSELSAHLNTDEIDIIMEAFDSIQTPLLGDEKEQATEKMIEFIKEKKLAKIIGEINREGINDTTYQNLEDVTSLKATDDSLFDFTDHDDIKRAKSLMFPPGCEDKVIPSSFSLINKASMFNGHIPGTVSMYAARPGLGKTTMLIQEGLAAVVAGFKVFHIILGDMGAYDVLAKYMACHKNTMINKLIGDLETHINNGVGSKILPNLKVSVHGAWELNADKIAALAKSVYRKFKYDVLIIDYDGNISPVKGDSLYESGGYTYARIHKLSKDIQVAVYIGCQTKITNWEDEVVPMNAAADSSRKQHAVDLMITLGKSEKIAPVGTLNIAKIRRGVGDIQMRVCLAGYKSKIIEVSEEEYQRVKQKTQMNETKVGKHS